tara:strand:+ start:140 stop:526 length:387 start_codon:yes stop_codon:yes gene_type:complete
MYHLQLAWLWLKENWKIPFLIAWSIFIWIISRNNAQAAIEVLEAKKESYDKHVISLKENHKKELSERDKLVKQYHDTIKELETKYQQNKKSLSVANKKRVKEIVEQSKGDPDEIKEKIEKLFNLSITD